MVARRRPVGHQNAKDAAPQSTVRKQPIDSIRRTVLRASTGRGDLNDAQWRVLEPLLPAVSEVGRPLKWTRRQLIDGIHWRVRTGAPWRDVPARYGSWQSVYGLFGGNATAPGQVYGH
ncbi:transposase [Actinomadura kijaniata]|uniref:transposase n=1 Tax=Actinomadura kijaniata TaxID=46161 RepID=UPI003F1C66F3